MIADGTKVDCKVMKLEDQIETLQSRNNKLQELLNAKNSLVNAMPADTMEKVTPS